MKKPYNVVINTTAGVFFSDTTELTDNEAERVHSELLRNLNKLSYISIEISEVTHYFNPANIIYAALVEEEEIL